MLVSMSWRWCLIDTLVSGLLQVLQLFMKPSVMKQMLIILLFLTGEHVKQSRHFYFKPRRKIFPGKWSQYQFTMVVHVFRWFSKYAWEICQGCQIEMYLIKQYKHLITFFTVRKHSNDVKILLRKFYDTFHIPNCLNIIHV